MSRELNYFFKIKKKFLETYKNSFFTYSVSINNIKVMFTFVTENNKNM